MQRITANKIKEFQSVLLRWYKRNGRKFPWRKNNLTNYQLIIAEVLLQRTKAETVSQFYGNFIKIFPNWAAIAAADPKDVEAYLKPIGLYKQRAKRVQNLAVEMVKRHGRLPRERWELEKIPFLGQYIANAIELMIFKSCSPLIDVNMARLLERYFGERKLSDIRYDPYLQKLSRKVVCHRNTRDLNWAILDFASIICKARNPLHHDCPLNKKCVYYKKFISTSISKKKAA